MRKALSLLILMLLATAGFAATTWVDQSSNLPSTATTGGLNSVFFIDENTGIAVGSGETIVKTTDGGLSWTKRAVGITFEGSAVYFPTSSVGFIVGWQGSDGVFLKTVDGGDFWSDVTPLLGATVSRDIFFIDANTGWVCGDTSRPVFKTADGGTTWTEMTSGFTVADKTLVYYGIYFVSSQIGWVVGENGRIYKTTDGASNWSPLTSGTANQLNDVYFADANTGWVVGNNGTILKTIDGGTNWTDESTGAANLNSISFANTSKGWVVGDGGVILTTTDGGSNWTSTTLSGTPDLRGVSFSNQYNGWVVGEGAATANVVETAAIIAVDSVTRTHPTAGSVSWESQGALRQITVTGENFNSGTTVSFPSSGISVYNVSPESVTQLNAMIWVPVAESTGLKDIKVTNTNTATDTLANAFEIRAGGTGPSITSYSVTNASTPSATSSILLSGVPQITLNLTETSDGLSKEAVRFTILIDNPPTYYWTFSPSGANFFTADEQSGSLITKAHVTSVWRKITSLSSSTSGSTSWIQNVFTATNKVPVYFYVEDANSVPVLMGAVNTLYNDEVYCLFDPPSEAVPTAITSNPISRNNRQLTLQAEVDETIANEMTTDGATLLINGPTGLMTNHNVVFKRVYSAASAACVRAAAAGKTLVQVTTDINDFNGHLPAAGIYAGVIRTARTKTVAAKFKAVVVPWGNGSF